MRCMLLQVKAVLCAALAPNVAVVADGCAPHLPPTWLTAVGLPKLSPAAGDGGSTARPGLQPVVSTEEVALHGSSVVHGLPA